MPIPTVIKIRRNVEKLIQEGTDPILAGLTARQKVRREEAKRRIRENAKRSEQEQRVEPDELVKGADKRLQLERSSKKSGNKSRRS